MDGTCEMWSLPWHALQRNLAQGIGGDTIVRFAATVKAAHVPGAAANSWLGRARLQAAPSPHQVQP